MSEIVLCPGCQSKLRWRDFQEDNHVKCPACACLFAPPVSAPPPAAEAPIPSLEIEPSLPPPAPIAPEIQSSQPTSPASSDFELTYSPPPPLQEEEFVAVIDESEPVNEPTIPFAPGELGPPKPVVRPPRRRKREHRSPSGWEGVFSGLGFVLASLGVTVVLFLVGTCGTMVTSGAAASQVSGDNPQPGAGTAVAGGGLILLTVIGWLGLAGIHALVITGHVFCLSAPPKYGARALAYVTLLLAILNVLVSLGGQFAGLSVTAVPPAAGPTASFMVAQVLALGPWVCTLAYLLVFLLFLRAVALGVEAYSLAETVVGVMIIFGLGSLVYLGTMAVAIVTGSELVLVLAIQGGLDLDTVSTLGLLLGIVGALGFLVWLGAMLWYINTLFQVRHAVGLHITGSSWTPAAP
jgi:hypothetical protein